MGKKQAAIIILVLVAAGIVEVSPVKADPILYNWIPLPAGFPPPSVEIVSPENNTIIRANSNLTVNFNATLDAPPNTYGYGIFYMAYKTSWNHGDLIYDLGNHWNPRPKITGNYSSSFDVNLTGVPEGKNNITVTIAAGGGYFDNEKSIYFNEFDVFVSCSVVFNVTYDFTPPKVAILSLKNQTFTNSTVPLNFTVDELVSQISYSLDGQDNVTLAGNTTLTGLSIGQHNITVYSTDIAGNVGASETTFFEIVPAITAPVVDVSAVAIAVVVVAVAVCVGLAVYFKKYRR